MTPNRAILIKRAQQAQRESKYIDFKSEFDVTSGAAWCELIKDIVAFANSGGGIVIFGVSNDGTDSAADTTPVLKCDIADITNRIARYTSYQFSEIEIVEVKRGQKKHPAFLILQTSVPIIFSKPGTYAVADGKQKTAFGQGTLYFRHGGKSEPGTYDDLVQWRDQALAQIRKTWLGGIRKVVEAPAGHNVTVVPATAGGSGHGHMISATISADPTAPKVAPLNAEEVWPYRRIDVIREVNKLLGKGRRINSHDIVCINRIYQVLKQPQFAYKPHHLASPQYSMAFVAWIVDQVGKDNNFLKKNRSKHKKLSSKKK